MNRTGGLEYLSNNAFGIWSKTYIKKRTNTLVSGSAGGVLLPAGTVLNEFILQPLANIKNFIIQANMSNGESLGLRVDGESLTLPGITDGGGKNLDQKLPALAFTRLEVYAVTAVHLSGYMLICEVEPNS